MALSERIRISYDEIRDESGRSENDPVAGALDEEQRKLSKELKAEFPDYVNSLHLKDDNGNELTLDKEGEGSFKDYVMSFVLASATKERADLDSQNKLKGLAVPGSEIAETKIISPITGNEQPV